MSHRTGLKRQAPSYGNGRRAYAGRSVAGKRQSHIARHRAPTRIYQAGETKYFDVAIAVTVTSGVSDWTASEVACATYVDTNGSSAAYTDSALVPSAIGAGYGQVNGNMYRLKKVRVRGQITRIVQVDQQDVIRAIPYRLMLVMDTQPNGAQAQGETIMQDAGDSGTMYSFKKMSDQGTRFRLLKDQTGMLQPAVAGTDGAAAADPVTVSQAWESAQFSFQYQPSVPITCNVKSGTATPAIAGVVNCNIFLLLHTFGNALLIEGAGRAYYTD